MLKHASFLWLCLSRPAGSAGMGRKGLLGMAHLCVGSSAFGSLTVPSGVGSVHVVTSHVSVCREPEHSIEVHPRVTSVLHSRTLVLLPPEEAHSLVWSLMTSSPSRIWTLGYRHNDLLSPRSPTSNSLACVSNYQTHWCMHRTRMLRY